MAKIADFGTAHFINERPKLGGDYVTSTEGTISFFAPEMCVSGTLSMGGYSARAADWWAYGVCLYMWVYHTAPFVAPTPMLLVEKIRTEPVPYDGDAHGAGQCVITLLRGLLAENPRNRYSLSDIRRDLFITAGGAQPLPEPDVPDHSQSLAKFELENAITRVMAEQSFIRANTTELLVAGGREDLRSQRLASSSESLVEGCEAEQADVFAHDNG
jgi:serine/threonine protein kinase